MDAQSSIATLMQGYVSPSVIQRLNQAEFSVEPHETHATVVALVIKGFFEVDQQAVLATLAATLRDHRTKMTEIVFESGGTLNSFEGSSLTACWGAPVAWPDSADRACIAAIRMLDGVQRTYSSADRHPRSRLRAGIGIATGAVIVGDIGPGQRFSYSILGEPVKLAHHLSDLTDQYRTPVILTKQTLDELRQPVETRHLDQLLLKNRPEPVTLYALLSHAA